MDNPQETLNIYNILRILRDYTLYPYYIINIIGWRYSPNYNWKVINYLNLDYATVFSLAPYMSANVVTIIGICLLIGAMAKSSQLGLHVWLPQAISLKSVADG